MADEVRPLDPELGPQRFEVRHELVETERRAGALGSAVPTEIVGDALEVGRKLRDDALPDLAPRADAVRQEHRGPGSHDRVFGANRLSHDEILLE